MGHIAAQVQHLFNESFVSPNDRPKDKQTEHRQSEFHHRFGAQRIAGHPSLRVSTASTDTALLEERVYPLEFHNYQGVLRHR